MTMGDLLTTRQAARIYGCHISNWSKMTKRSGLKPARIVTTQTSRYYLWRPVDILNLRKRLKAKAFARRAQQRIAAARPRLNQAQRNILLGIQRRRAKRLAREMK
jgi:hypothetical protein